MIKMSLKKGEYFFVKKYQSIKLSDLDKKQKRRKRLGQTPEAFGLNTGSVWAKHKERIPVQ